MMVMDGINERYGRGWLRKTLKVGNLLSPYYTTRWSDIVTVTFREQ